MIDIKNPAPFYTLKEASSELNKLLNTHYYNSKRLLYVALTYDLKLYVYSQEWEGGYLLELEMTSEYENYLNKQKANDSKYSEALLLRHKTLSVINTYAACCILDNGCLLQLPLEAIRIASYKKEFEFNSHRYPFPEAIYLEDAFASNTKNYLLEVLRKADPCFFEDIFGRTLDMRTLEAIVDIEIKGIELENPYDGMIHAKPKPSENFEIEELSRNGESIKFFNHIIHRKDILITHYQLTRIINGALTIRENEYCNRPELIARHLSKKPQGKSKEKEAAQLAAKTLANYLWNQDKGNKIKIKEMAIQVHAELNQTEHREQLPDQSVSLKKWIEDIAPEYAREAGRPKEI